MSKNMNLVRAEMGDAEFRRFSDMIQRELGIKMPPTKKVLLQSRFQKRLRALGMSTYKEYCDYVFSDAGREAERQHMVDVVTTNTTHFFREPKHFDILTNKVLPEFWRTIGSSREIRIWSAGCSSGEEPYTLGMVLSDFAEKHNGFKFSITATDISFQILQRARNAVYPLEKADEIPQQYKKKYLLKSKDPKKPLMKIDKKVRDRVSFKQINFMDDFRMDQKMDIIFCRNVVIYFDRPTQEVLFDKFCNFIRTDGYLFIGHSESLSGMRLPIKQMAPTVFKRLP
ncbi:CheR family methyltransferase [Salidesulfovibrio brasiliensis]